MKTHRHWVTFLSPWSLGALFCVIVGLTWLALFVFFCDVLRWYCDFVEADAAIFRHRRGIVSINVDEIKRGQIESVAVSKPPLGRLLGYGNLHVIGSGSTDLTITHVPHADDWVRLLTHPTV
jgi:uncharacterized membrane protein YdbT with pleckstrin-like domain